MNKNKNFLDQLDGGWGDLIADTYREENEINTIFYGSYYGKTFSYNVNNMFRRELFKLPIDIITNPFSMDTAQIIIPRELIDPALCTGPINDLYEIIIEIRFCGIDIDTLYEFGKLSEEEFETGKVEKDHSDIIIDIKYEFADNSKAVYFETCSHDKESNKVSNYTIETAIGPVLLYADLELMKYFVEKSAELYINIPQRLLPISKETKNRMYNLISEVNQQNSELAKK